MRADEFVFEGKSGSVPKSAEKASREVVKMRDDGIDRSYHLNRVMMAAAMHDGKTKDAVKDMDSSSWAEKFNTAHPYTQEESNMIHGAIKTIGGKHNDIVNDPHSLELPEVHKVSPVKGFSGYKRK